MERQCWVNAQYARRECIEIVGIPKKLDHKSLEDKFVTMFQKIGCHISTKNIEDRHRLSKKSGKVVVKFSKRKNCQQALRVKKDLRHLNIDELEFYEGKKIFISRILCSHFRVL